MNKIKTRFAPSPTGYLHIGGARTALFSWAFAKHFAENGSCVLRIEDTDLERSTPEAVQAIFDGLNWLNLKFDEGPFYQMQRMDRYREVIQQMLRDGKAYYCYCSKEELEIMREEQTKQGLKARYNGKWRDSTETPPEGVSPVIRFKNPLDGVVTFKDLIRGDITVANKELDDLIIARSDGTPTYNFCVVVDDYDMGITHVIRGDDHINNTPRQINILQALGANLPEYAHVPMILGADGEKLSKRHGAVSVTQYYDDGFLPEAVLNYLGRLGWSHGDDEIFNIEQFIEWFNLESVSHSPARFDTEKLLWLNQHYIKNTESSKLAELVLPFLEKQNIKTAISENMIKILDLVKERANTMIQLAQEMQYFYVYKNPSDKLINKHIDDSNREVLKNIVDHLDALGDFTKPAIHDIIHATAKESKLKLGKIMMPIRVLITGTDHSPSIDSILELLGKEESLHRLRKYL